MLAARINLLKDAWMPMRRLSGKVEMRPPSGVLDGVRGDDPFIGFSWGRSDFDQCSIEFLVGLFSTCALVSDEAEWQALWLEADGPDALHGRMCGRFAHCFGIDGPKAFMQECKETEGHEDLLEAKNWPVDALIPGGAGDQTIKHRQDLFNPARPANAVLSQGAAAMCLFIMQQACGSAGGSGYRTGLRGGGPLTTLVRARPRLVNGTPRLAYSIWERVWPNVETLEQQVERCVAGASFADEDAFPWMSPSPTSGGSPPKQVHAASTHPAHVYWGMPGRVRLVFSSSSGVCAVTGERIIGDCVSGCLKTKQGISYGDGFVHPLSPRLLVADDGNVVLDKSLSAVPDRSDFQNLPVLMVAKQFERKQGKKSVVESPAPTAAYALTSRCFSFAPGGLFVDAHGFSLKQAAVQEWLHFSAPAFALPKAAGDRYANEIFALAEAGDLYRNALRRALDQCLCGTKMRKTEKTAALSSFLHESENGFRRVADAVGKALSLGGSPSDVDKEIATAKTGWCSEAHRLAQGALDRFAPLSGSGAPHPELGIKARRTIHSAVKRARERLSLPAEPQSGNQAKKAAA